jgi:hypothetical protein
VNVFLQKKLTKFVVMTSTVLILRTTTAANIVIHVIDNVCPVMVLLKLIAAPAATV